MTTKSVLRSYYLSAKGLMCGMRFDIDVERLLRIGNAFARESDKAEAIKHFALNVCRESLPTIVNISKITPDLRFEHFAGFGNDYKTLDSLRSLELSEAPLFNELISSQEIRFYPLDNDFFARFGQPHIEHKMGWKTVVAFSINNNFVVTITFQTELKQSEDVLVHFEILRAMLSIYLGAFYNSEQGRSSLTVRNGNDKNGNELTPRQQQVLKYIREGLTNVSIATIMGYSESLIKQETMAIYQKLGILGRKDISNSNTN